MTITFARFLALFFFLATMLPASAEEFILSYDSTISIAKNGELTVTETIKARAEGDRIKHGIYRDFPLYTLDGDGKLTKVGFNIVSVKRDGAVEYWDTKWIDGGIRIYVGDANRVLTRGDHVFQITYTTDRQIRHFDTYDELTWNVTGTGWDFPMRDVSATILLPEGTSPSETAFFTGPPGAVGKDAHAFTKGNRISFISTRPFSKGEGMTVAVKLPKGVLDTLSTVLQREWWMRDHKTMIIGCVGLPVVLAYYFKAWSAVGRDPAAGIVVPRWDPPEGVSPGLMNYIDHQGFEEDGWTAVSASTLDLAVKGYVEIENLDEAIIINRTHKQMEDSLPVGQKTLLTTIGPPGHRFIIGEDNGKTVEKMGERFFAAVEKEHRGRYFKSNAIYSVVGFLVSAAFVIGTVYFSRYKEDMWEFMLIAYGFVPVTIALLTISIGELLHPKASLKNKLSGIALLSLVAYGIVAFGGYVIGAIWFEITHDPNSIGLGAAGLIVLVNLLFFSLMGAPTPLGRKVMDEIEGLRLYLRVAERDRMNMQGAPTMSPQHFETLLPYAVALNVEEPWTEAFERWFSKATEGSNDYVPRWYYGNVTGLSDKVGALASSMSTILYDTIPRSSS
ncbi:DUF2207 domain-containing protein [Agrobacterium larrymoorei]|uniref:DUF2207 domain-containing protein n=1 Tax=Agrobacterium larrymoorei TaxID=160699 RepID=A0ABU0UJV1_9HYPH|nr:DUF2207 domain-containing protein [Agrobacterium larrymoorei]MDQ1185220.1 hypothetical protein [Agrobacterium larrymoorei]